jgi:hypothetical protein
VRFLRGVRIYLEGGQQEDPSYAFASINVFDRTGKKGENFCYTPVSVAGSQSEEYQTSIKGKISHSPR